MYIVTHTLAGIIIEQTFALPMDEIFKHLGELNVLKIVGDDEAVLFIAPQQKTPA